MSTTTYFEPQAGMALRDVRRAEIFLVGTDGAKVVGEHIPTGATIQGSRWRDIFSDAPEWRMDLEPNTEISPAGTKWARDLTGSGVSAADPPIYFDVIASATAQNVNAHLTPAPTDVPDSLLSAHIVRTHKKFVKVPDGWGENWFQERALAGSKIVGVDFWGDSIGAQGLGTTDLRLNSVPGRTEAALQAAFGDGGSGYLTYEHSDAGTRTGTYVAEVGFGGGANRTSGAASMRWLLVRGTTIRLFFKNAGVTGVQRWRIDGGGWRSVTTPHVFGIDPASDDVTGLSDTAHLVEWEWVSGTVAVCGIYAERATGINVRRFGVNGRAACQYSLGVIEKRRIGTTNASPTVTSNPGFFRADMVGKYISCNNLPASCLITAVGSSTSLTVNQNANATSTVDADFCQYDTFGSVVPMRTTNFFPFLNVAGMGMPALIVMCIGANDAIHASSNPEFMEHGLSSILKPYYNGSTFAAQPSVAFIVEHQGNWFDVTGIWPIMASNLARTAEGMGAVLVDAWGIGRRSHEWASLQGWFADDIHPNDLGVQQMYSTPLLSALMLDAA